MSQDMQPAADPLDVSLFADAFRDSPVASVILEAGGNVRFWNNAAERIFGWSENEVIGKPLPFIPAERVAEHRLMRKRDLDGQGFTERHITRVRKDGTPVELSVSTAPIRGASGRVTGILSVYTDISEEKRAEESLRMRQALANEQLVELERFYATAPIGLGFLDTELRYVRVNERLAQINSATVPQHIGKRLDEIVPEFAACIEPVCREVMASGIAIIEREIQSATPALPGIARDWLVSFHPLKQPDGTVLGVTTVVSDVTERKRLTDQLKRQEAQLRLVIDGMPGLVGYIDRNYRYQFNNRVYAEWFLRPASDFEGRTVTEALSPAAFESIRAHVDRALQGESVAYERRMEYADAARDVRITYVPDRDPNGEVRGIVVLVQDVSEQKRAEQALRDSEERFRRIVEIAAEGIWIVDGEGRTTFVNQRMSDLLLYPPEEMMGRSYFDFLDAEERERARSGFAKRKHGDTSPKEYRFRRKDSTAVWLDITASVMQDDAGNVTGVLGMCTDITERKEKERQLRQTQKLESLGILAGGIAHDFNNLLVGIMGNASLAVDAVAAAPGVRPMLQDVISASERAAQLTRQLLAYAGKDHGVSEPVDVAVLVRELTPLLSTSIPKMVHLNLELENGAPPVQADPAQLQQVVMNLVINAAESIPDRSAGTVNISVARRGLEPDDHHAAVIPIENAAEEYVALSVADNGSGMDVPTQARIFDPFFTTKFDGRGLGLSAVLGIVKGHNGTITLRTAPGKGTTFTVLLPASTTGARSSAARAARPPAATGTGTILVVDDEPSVRKLAQRVLERSGYRVLMAEDGQGAIDMVSQHPEISAVVLDLAMPVMSGETAAPILRARRPHLPLILSSGYSESDAMERFGRELLTGFLQKPYAPPALLTKVAEVLAGRNS